MLYSLNGGWPSAKPTRIRLPDGTTRTGDLTTEQLTAAGYTEVSDRPTVNANQVVYWDSTGINWVIRPKTADELQIDLTKQWTYVREVRDSMLKELDWRINRYNSQVRLGLPVVDDIAALDTYAQALRDVTKQTDPFNITWPDPI